MSRLGMRSVLATLAVTAFVAPSAFAAASSTTPRHQAPGAETGVVSTLTALRSVSIATADDYEKRLWQQQDAYNATQRAHPYAHR